MIGKEWIGQESETLEVMIQPEDVRRYAEVIGITYNHQVPMTFISTLRLPNFPGLEFPSAGVIHGEQKFTLYRQLKEREKLSYKRLIKDIYEREGRLGKMQLIIVVTTGYDLTGEPVFTSQSTLILPLKTGGNGS